MPLIPIFHGRIDAAGKFELAETERSQRALHFKALAGSSGCNVEIIVRKERTKRSVGQNAYLHAVVFPLLAKEMCDSVEGVKFDLMGEKWGWTSTKRGHHIPVKPHTSEMTVEECSEFIDWVIPWAALYHNISIPLPGEAVSA